jgi:lysophospholipase L1-like esterase
MDVAGRAIVVSCGLAIGLLVSEALVRLLDIAPQVEVMSDQAYRYSANPRLGWEPVPLAERRTLKGGINELGYRDLNHSVAKSPGVLRILVIGDSIAQGTRIKDDMAIFPRVLEAALRQKGVPAEVQNFGVQGYNTQQEVETLRTRGLAYSPDVVILSYCLNDRSFQAGAMPHAMTRTALQRQAVDASLMLRWLTKSALFRYVYFGVFFTYTGAQAELQKRFGAVLADTVKPSFETLSALSRAHHFAVIVSVFPLFPRKKAEVFEEYSYLPEHAYVRRLSEENAFTHLDLLETFRACAKGGPVAIDIYHPNERGHRCAAEALAAQIERIRPVLRSQGAGALSTPSA